MKIVKDGIDNLSITLIPQNLSRTILGKKKKGDLVNLEFDHTTKVIVQTVERIYSEIIGKHRPWRSRKKAYLNSKEWIKVLTVKYLKVIIISFAGVERKFFEKGIRRDRKPVPTYFN